MKQVQTTVYLLPSIAKELEQEERILSKKKAINAAVWMFHRADAKAKLDAVYAVAASWDEEIGESDYDVANEPQQPQPIQQHKPGAVRRGS